MTPHPGGPAGSQAERARRATREEARARGLARLRDAGLEAREAWVEADLLLRHAAGLSREETLLRPHAPIGDETGGVYAALIARRAAGCPSAYLVGHREFCGLVLDVDSRVLIPRPETERLVEVVAAALGPRPAPLIVDVGTGSGAIACALLHLLPGARAVATDTSSAALEVARANGERLGLAGRITWRCGDGLEALAGAVPAAGADAVCANPPYVPSADIETLAPEVREHEPRAALDGGPDGLAVHRRIVEGAGAYLKPGGLLALEACAEGHQAHAVAALIAAAGGFAPAEIVQDYAGLDRVVIAARLGAAAEWGNAR